MKRNGHLKDRSNEKLDNNKLSICFFGNISSIHMQRWIYYFTLMNYEIHIISWRKYVDHNIVLDNVNIHYIKSPPFFYFRNISYYEICKIVNMIKPDIVHAHYLSHFGILGYWYCKENPNIPLVLTVWGSDLLINCRGKVLNIIFDAIKYANLITCDAIHIQDKLYSFGAKNVKIIQFGTDVKHFSNIESGNRIFDDEESLNNQKIVISLRNLEPIYDVETLINAIPIIINNYPYVKFLIFGKGSCEKNLRKLTKNLNVEENTLFMGSYNQKDLPIYLSSSDIYISTSLSDAGLSASTAEAMSCGLPVIISDFGDNKEWVVNDENGYLFPLKDYKILAEKIILLLNNDEKRAEFGKKNREIIVNRNNYYKEMEKMNKLYLELLGE